MGPAQLSAAPIRQFLTGVCCTARVLTLRSRPIVSWAATADRSWRLIMCKAALAAP